MTTIRDLNMLSDEALFIKRMEMQYNKNQKILGYSIDKYNPLTIELFKRIANSNTSPNISIRDLDIENLRSKHRIFLELKMICRAHGILINNIKFIISTEPDIKWLKNKQLYKELTGKNLGE